MTPISSLQPDRSWYPSRSSSTSLIRPFDEDPGSTKYEELPPSTIGSTTALLPGLYIFGLTICGRNVEASSDVTSC